MRCYGFDNSVCGGIKRDVKLNNIDNIMVTQVICNCGKVRMNALTEHMDSKTMKEIDKLLKKGCKVRNVSINDARNSILCFNKSCVK